MKFSRFIAATSPWSAVVNAPASAASGSRPGVAWTLVSNCTRDRKSRARRETSATDLDPLRMFAEKVEVEAEVEDAELVLVVPGVRTDRGTGGCRARSSART